VRHRAVHRPVHRLRLGHPLVRQDRRRARPQLPDRALGQEEFREHVGAAGVTADERDATAAGRDLTADLVPGDPLLQLTVGEAHRPERPPADTGPPAHEVLRVEHRQRTVELPRRGRELGLGGVDEARAALPERVRAAVHVPPSVRVGHVHEVLVAGPHRGHGAHPGSAGHLVRLAEAVAVDLGDHEPRGVPRHVRVVPLVPRERGPARVGLRVRDEVGLGAQPGHHAGEDVDAHQRVDHLRAVDLGDGVHHVAGERQVRVAHAVVRGDGSRLGPAVVARHGDVQAGVGPLREDAHAVRDVEVPAPVLVHRRGHVDGGAVGVDGGDGVVAAVRRPHDDATAVPAGLLPVGGLAVDAWRGEPDDGGGHLREGEGGGPGAVRRGGGGHGASLVRPCVHRRDASYSGGSAHTRRPDVRTGPRDASPGPAGTGDRRAHRARRGDPRVPRHERGTNRRPPGSEPRGCGTHDRHPPGVRLATGPHRLRHRAPVLRPQDPHRPARLQPVAAARRDLRLPRPR